MTHTITFSSSAKPFILDTFDKAVTEEGLVVEKSSSQAVIAIDGQEMTIEEFSGIKKGSEIYIKDDVSSLIQLCRKIHSDRT